MAKFVVEIELGNDAMLTFRDVFELLSFEGYKIREGSYGDLWREELVANYNNNLKDANGNRVGSWKVIDK